MGNSIILLSSFIIFEFVAFFTAYITHKRDNLSILKSFLCYQTLPVGGTIYIGIIILFVTK